jgi:polyhydroxyalkanoate synthesis regulator phasin
MNNMRFRITISAILLATSFAAFASKPETLQQLIARAESARLEDRPALYVEIAERQLTSADDLYTAGKVDDARAALQDLVTYSEKAHDSAIQSGKKLKGTEITFRKMAAKLRDIKRNLNFDDQAPVQTATDRLESLRTDLLSHMFGKGKGK